MNILQLGKGKERGHGIGEGTLPEGRCGGEDGQWLVWFTRLETCQGQDLSVIRVCILTQCLALERSLASVS